MELTNMEDAKPGKLWEEERREGTKETNDVVGKGTEWGWGRYEIHQVVKTIIWFFSLKWQGFFTLMPRVLPWFSKRMANFYVWINGPFLKSMLLSFFPFSFCGEPCLGQRERMMRWAKSPSFGRRGEEEENIFWWIFLEREAKVTNESLFEWIEKWLGRRDWGRKGGKRKTWPQKRKSFCIFEHFSSCSCNMSHAIYFGLLFLCSPAATISSAINAGNRRRERVTMPSAKGKPPFYCYCESNNSGYNLREKEDKWRTNCPTFPISTSWSANRAQWKIKKGF